MTILHIENTVHDYDRWKAAFDKFDRLRADNGVRSYRITRFVTDPQRVNVDLDFAGPAQADAFRTILEKVWRTPQSREQLIAHAEPLLLEVAEERVLA